MTEVGSALNGHRRGGRRWLVAIGAALVAGVLCGAYLLGAQHGDTATPPPRTEHAADPEPPRPVAASADPVESAQAWLRGYRTISHTDGQAAGWVGRVDPVVTGDLAREYHAALDAGGDLAWHTYTAQRCTTQVTEASAVIPAEAPHTDTQTWAQVQGQAATTCEVGLPPGDPSEHIAATVELHKGPDGRWRVARRLY